MEVVVVDRFAQDLVDEPYNKNQYIFSLDIGTRSVMGLVAQKIDGVYTVVDYEVEVHPDRAMLDGQIHDIDKVTKVVSRVKSILENRNNQIFEEVSIAAAGRALKTNQVSISHNLDSTAEISNEIIEMIEMEGVQKAQNSLVERDGQADKLRYYCVGYSVINYYLDETMIINPEGHRGSLLEANIVATFLPHIVVDSLYTVMGRCGLQVASLTLEPIAAINIAVPQKLRLLNLALVDVGAGTSDVAVTKDGTILSYGMVDKAGDEITEALVRTFLLDFEMAESLKLRLFKEDILEFTDVVGIRYRKSKEEIIEQILPIIEDITACIADKIREINEKAPSAVFCIGGGCQVPLFVERLAEALDMPKDRVVIKGSESLDNVKFEKMPLIGPEFITPIGIGFTKTIQQNQDFVQVLVNEVPVRLLNAKSLKVSDALIILGFSARKLLPKKGESFTVTVNGQSRLISGKYGESAKIWVNGVPSALGTAIYNRDRIVVEPATVGSKNAVKLKEFIDLREYVLVNNKRINFIQTVKINGRIETGDYVLLENDNIEYDVITTVAQLSEFLDLPIMDNLFIMDGESLPATYVLKNKDSIHVNRQLMNEFIDIGDHRSTESNPRIEKVVRFDRVKHNPPQSHRLDRLKNTISFSGYLSEKFQNEQNDSNDVDYSMRHENYDAIEEEALEPIYNEISDDSIVFEQEKPKRYNYIITVNGKTIQILDLKSEMIFVDIFNYIEFNPNRTNAVLELTINGKRASYTDKIKSGDVINIAWIEK